ncbi:MAG: M23 family metallopeptidase [Candidatus Limivicinus sp.]|nr:M23 family metallopeptidase [Clostridiales bacterium]MDY6131959.1 M23 family metallopeptidase [Candidatus Limivicinus sp.]
MNSRGSGKKLEGFFTGKGFYIVLFLCAAVIGVSAWMMATGNETMENDPVRNNSASFDDKRVETVIVPAQSGTAETGALEADAPEVNTEGLAENAEVQDSEAVAAVEEQPVVEAAAPIYVWPVAGQVERAHSSDTLSYDQTLRDWRTHEGIDIIAELGAPVVAAHSGSVESIVQDSLYGTVVTVSHGDGTRTIYANLAENPPVNVGDWIDCGTTIGSVGSTALCEISQTSHLHFAITVNGTAADPMDYLPV